MILEVLAKIWISESKNYIIKLLKLYTNFLNSLLQIGDSGKSVRELEKTIALLKKVVERVQMENEELKKAPHIAGNEELQKLRLDNAGLKVRG